MTMPMGIAATMTGMSSGKPKKATHRGRKPSGKPGASHLSALQQAHGAGDFKAAKTHALNYAKAVHGHTEPDAEAGEVADADDAPTSMAPPMKAPSAPTSSSNQRAMLAKLAMSRKK